MTLIQFLSKRLLDPFPFSTCMNIWPVYMWKIVKLLAEIIALLVLEKMRPGRDQIMSSKTLKVAMKKRDILYKDLSWYNKREWVISGKIVCVGSKKKKCLLWGPLNIRIGCLEKWWNLPWWNYPKLRLT